MKKFKLYLFPNKKLRKLVNECKDELIIDFVILEFVSIFRDLVTREKYQESLTNILSKIEEYPQNSFKKGEIIYDIINSNIDDLYSNIIDEFAKNGILNKSKVDESINSIKTFSEHENILTELQRLTQLYK